MAAHLSIQELSNELEIRIRHGQKSDIPLIIFLTFWLTAWACAEGFGLYSLFAKGTPIMIRAFFVIWLIPWTVGGIFAFLSLLEKIGGIEVIRVGRGMLQTSRSYIILKINKRYDLFKVTDLHTHFKKPGKLSFLSAGMIMFRYENKNVRFGSGLSTEEKQEILERLKSHRDLNERNFRQSD